MEYRNVRAKNTFGIIEGERKDEIVIVVATTILGSQS